MPCEEAVLYPTHQEETCALFVKKQPPGSCNTFWWLMISLYSTLRYISDSKCSAFSAAGNRKVQFLTQKTLHKSNGKDAILILKLNSGLSRTLSKEKTKTKKNKTFFVAWILIKTLFAVVDLQSCFVCTNFECPSHRHPKVDKKPSFGPFSTLAEILLPFALQKHYPGWALSADWSWVPQKDKQSHKSCPMVMKFVSPPELDPVEPSPEELHAKRKEKKKLMEWRYWLLLHFWKIALSVIWWVKIKDERIVF